MCRSASGIRFRHPQRCNTAAFGTPPKAGRAGDTDSSGCLDRANPGQDQFLVLVLNAEPSFTSTSSHNFHTPNSDGVLRRDLEPAWRYWPCFQSALTELIADDTL